MIAVDWGTTIFRAYRLDAAGRIGETRSAPAGIMAVAAGGFSRILEEQLGDWLAETPIVMSGMIGSRQGWLEIPYVKCPAGAAEIADGVRAVSWGDGRQAWIAPGLSCRDESGVPDVLRGEETQLLGVLSDLPGGEATICLPGTHSKWVRLSDGQILSFATALTGETFAVLRRHSLLGRLMPRGEDVDDDTWFDAGVRRAGEPGGVLHHLFGVRSRGLFGEVPEASLASYLSGILIGREIIDLAPASGTIHLIGTPRLVALYERALRASGRDSRTLDPECVVRGLFLLAARLPSGTP